MLLVQLQVKPSFAFLGAGASEATTFHFWRATHTSPSPSSSISLTDSCFLLVSFPTSHFLLHPFGTVSWFSSSSVVQP